MKLTGRRDGTVGHCRPEAVVEQSVIAPLIAERVLREGVAFLAVADFLVLDSDLVRDALVFTTGHTPALVGEPGKSLSVVSQPVSYWNCNACRLTPLVMHRPLPLPSRWGSAPYHWELKMSEAGKLPALLVSFHHGWGPLKPHSVRSSSRNMKR